MAKKWSERTEAEFNEFIQDPANKPLLQPVLQRHPDADQDETHLFEAIGKDLDSEQEIVRQEALWALKPLIPEIDEVLYVQKKSQENIIDHLIREFVKEHRFSIKRGKDPRPLVKKVIENWRNDGEKREDRIISLDKPLVAGEEGISLHSILPSPTLFEDEVVDRLLLEEFVATLDFLTKNEKSVIEAALANWPTRMIAEELGITEIAVRHLKSRARRKILARGELLDSYGSHRLNIIPSIELYDHSINLLVKDFGITQKVFKGIAACHFYVDSRLRSAVSGDVWTKRWPYFVQKSLMNNGRRINASICYYPLCERSRMPIQPQVCHMLSCRVSKEMANYLLLMALASKGFNIKH